MKILTNKKQNELISKLKKLNKLIVDSNINLEAFDLLADIGCSVLDLKHLNRIENEIIEDMFNKEDFE